MSTAPGRSQASSHRSPQGEGTPVSTASSKRGAVPARYRWLVASRVAAAAIGGYALTSAATVLMGLLWPAPKVQAILWATMLSFAVYAVAVIWVIHTRSVKRAWAGMVIGTAVLSVLALLLKMGGGA